MGQRYQLPDGRIAEQMTDGTYHVQPAAPQMGPLADPRLPYQVQQAQGQAAAAPLEVPKTKAEIARTQQQIAAQPLQNASTVANTQQSIASIQNQKFNQLQGLRQEFNNLPEIKAYSDAITSLGGALKAPDTPQGDLSIVYSYAKAMDPGSVVREGEMDMANSTASLPQALQVQAERLTQGKRLPPEVRTGLIETMRQRVNAMRQGYDQQRARYADAAKSNGFDPQQIVGHPLYDAIRPLEENYIKAHGGVPRDPFAPADPATQLATGSFRNEYDPKLSAQMDALIRKGVPYAQATALAQQAGFNPIDKGQYAAAVAYAKQHPSYKNSLAEATRSVPTTTFQQIAASPVGAALAGAGKAATLGFGDELAASFMPGDYNINRDALNAKAGLLADQNPTADLLGQITGGATAGYGISGALSKVPGLAGGVFGKTLPNVLSREGVLGDALYGGGYGAGTDNENRLSGGFKGAALGIGGGAAARGALGGIASAISPTGGELRPLYDMGVRPSIGQRVGGPINSLEEKFQSIPIVGDAIAGTRDRARDQFQTGLFNDAMGQIGTKLPDGVGPGHAAHAFAQDAISNAYNGALSGMTAAADGQLSQDLGGIQRLVATLKPDHRAQFSKIWADSVARRFQNGQLAGDAYKSAESELSSRIAKLRANPADNELADALEQATGALRASALRNSPPDAVAALNAADAAHARIVRLENASRSAGGEPAEFSPKQYNNAVRTASGGVRNRNYLRGDALNSDIAALGTRLGDKVSNSGSIDRLAAGMAATGAGYLNPYAATALGGLGVLNAPGVRNVTTELMAPRANPLFDRAAEQLRQRARLAGMFGAPVALDYFGGQ